MSRPAGTTDAPLGTKRHRARTFSFGLRVLSSMAVWPRTRLQPTAAGLLALLLAGCVPPPGKESPPDVDGDGYEASTSGGEDCDDADAEVNPDADEVCDGLDNDCDGEVDEAVTVDAPTWYGDADGDGYGVEETTTLACTQPEGFAAVPGDCDDTDASVNPGRVDEPYNGLDDDCDASTADEDQDGDGHHPPEGGGEDCDDHDPSTYPGAEEICGDWVVNDCNSDEASARSDCELGGTVNLSTAELKLVGESPTDEAGQRISGAGDVDGDGFADVLLGVDNDDSAGSSAGAAYLVLGGPARLAAGSPLDLSSADLKLLGEGVEVGAGTWVSSAGDVNRDGFDDILVSAPSDGEAGELAGAAYLLLGGPTLMAGAPGPSLSVADLKLTGEHPQDQAGFTVSGAGDVDGDGYDDILVSSIAESSNGPDAGAVYLVLGGPALMSAGSKRSLATAELKLTGGADLDRAGVSMDGAGDVDGDGFADLLIGASAADSEGFNRGAAYLMLGGPSLFAGPWSLRLSTADLQLLGEADEDGAGWSVSQAGDVDGDGYPDLLVGAYGEDTGSSRAGAAYLVLGGSGLASSGTSRSLSSADLKLIGEEENDSAGGATSGAGDVNGDGFDDLLVAAHRHEDNPTSGGAVYLILGGTALAGSTRSLSSAEVKFIAESSNDDAGWSVSGAGDVDGDGRDDLLIGAPGDNDGGSDAGAGYLVLGRGY